jgi:hypothetical protein
MRGRTRRTAAVGAAAFLLAGSAVLTVSSGTASADTIDAQCGQTVTAKPGDTINTPFGLKTITDGVTSLVGGLLGSLCTITVNIVDTAVAPLPVVGSPVAGVVDGTVAGTTNGLGNVLPGKQASPPPASQDGGAKSQPAPAPQGAPAPAAIPAPNSPVLTSDVPVLELLPFGSPGYAPIRDYSGIPYALAASWAPSPGIRYGGDIPGYAPEAGALNPATRSGGPVQNAGRAEALPAGPEPDGLLLGLPTLVAVLALSVVTAGMVRSWVLRGTR